MFRVCRTFPGLVVVVAFLVGVLGWVKGVEAQFTRCDGNAPAVKNERVRAKVQNLPYGEGQFVEVPDASIGFSVPPGTEDTVVVTFTAECRLDNGSSSTHYMAVQVLVDEEVMHPDSESAGGFGTRLCSANTWATYTATYCSRVDQGLHTVQVYARVVEEADPDGDSPPALTGVLGSWTLRLQTSD